MDWEYWIRTATDWLQTIPAVWVYLFIFVIAYLENIVPPIPGDLFVVYGGYLAGMDVLHGWIVWPAAALGGALGFMSLYGVANRWGEKALQSKWLRWADGRGLKRTRGWMKRRGIIVVLANRFLSGARSVISLAAGLSHLNFTKTTIAATISAAVWCGGLVLGGIWVGERWRIIEEYLRTYSHFVFTFIIIFLLFNVIRGFIRNRRDRENIEESVNI